LGRSLKGGAKGAEGIGGFFQAGEKQKRKRRGIRKRASVAEGRGGKVKKTGRLRGTEVPIEKGQKVFSVQV